MAGWHRCRKNSKVAKTAWISVPVSHGDRCKATGDVAVEVELLSRIGGLQGKLALCKCNFPPIHK